jgi:hypothetical protein
MTPVEWEALIAARLLPRMDCSTPLRAEDERSFALYARLVASFRFGTISELLPNTTRLLLIALGEDALRALLADYVASVPPALFPSDEVLAFRRFMAARPLSVPGLEDMLRFETALLESIADNRSVRVVLSRDIETLLADIAANRPPAPAHGAITVEIGADTGPFVRVLAETTPVTNVARPAHG